MTTSLGTLQSLKLTENGGIGAPTLIPCSDFGFLSQSKFLVVIHPAGLVNLYDGVSQVRNTFSFFL